MNFNEWIESDDKTWEEWLAKLVEEQGEVAAAQLKVIRDRPGEVLKHLEHLEEELTHVEFIVSQYKLRVHKQVMSFKRFSRGRD
jgi:NTP pyrophosphatase (non-canonical NTP hydrolase)